MKTATIRELRYDFPKIEAWIAAGEEIVITRRSKAVARIGPPRETAKGLPAQPDYEGRLKRIWGDRVFSREEIEELRALETAER